MVEFLSEAASPISVQGQRETIYSGSVPREERSTGGVGGSMLGKQTVSTVAENVVVYGNDPVDGPNIAYREAGCPEAPEVVFLHGFPSSSHQFRQMLPELGNRFHMLAPDSPGFGNSEMPDPARYEYTFDKIADVIEEFLRLKGFETYGLY